MAQFPPVRMLHARKTTAIQYPVQLAVNPVVKLVNTEIGGPLPNKSQLARADRSLKVYHMNLYCYHAHYCT